MKKVRVYTKDYCPYCDRAKYLLNLRQIPFEEIDLTNDHELREKIAAPHHWKTLPMVFIGDEFVGGYNDLATLDKQGTLLDKVQF